jgi:hypothetical protein
MKKGRPTIDYNCTALFLHHIHMKFVAFQFQEHRYYSECIIYQPGMVSACAVKGLKCAKGSVKC